MVYANFYVNSVWYTPLSERLSVKPARFLLQPFSFKLYTMVSNDNLDSDGIMYDPIDYLILSQCVAKVENVEGLSDVTLLPLGIQHDLINKIINLYYPDEQFYKKLELVLDLTLDNRFSNESWDCNKCKEKRLDRQRNCPYLDHDEYHDPSFNIQVGESIYSTCPMEFKDSYLLSKVIEAHRIAESGFLPETGAYGDQPVFWAVASQKMKNKIAFYERKYMDEERAKSKR